MAYPMPKGPVKPFSTMGNDGGAVNAMPAAGKSWLKGLITLIVILVIVGLGIYLIASYTGVGGGSFVSKPILKADWQAVFLANGQVYFGKIVKIDKDYVDLKNIYYLQVINQPLQTSQNAANADQQQQTEQRLTLIKLGNEIHGPSDEMLINRSQVVLLEDLKNDSRVVQAINDYLKSQKK